MQPFIVKIVGLASGKSVHEWAAGAEFFESFGNQDILDADLKVVVEIDNHGITADARCSIQGSVTVPCDRCLEDLEIPIDTGFEESYVPDGEDLDFSQDVYDYVCIAMPLQKVHEEGECNEETIKFLSK